MSNLESTIQSLASTFAANVVTMLRGASIRELLEITGAEPTRTVGGGPEAGNGRTPRAAGGRLPRRSAGDLGAMVGQIVAELAKHETGLRSEGLRAVFGCGHEDGREAGNGLLRGLRSEEGRSQPWEEGPLEAEDGDQGHGCSPQRTAGSASPVSTKQEQVLQSEGEGHRVLSSAGHAKTAPSLML
jgi:hypothetical protein